MEQTLTVEQNNLLDLFRKREALLEGHFILSSGLHSDRYLQSALLLQDPLLAEDLGRKIADRFPSLIQMVVSPAIGGILIGQEVARAKKCKAIFVEKDDQGKPSLRRGFAVRRDEPVLVVEDVITTGLSTSEVLELLKQAQAHVVGVGAIVNRSGNHNEKLLKWKIPISSLLTLDVKSWSEQDCPLCKQQLPATKPGSRKR